MVITMPQEYTYSIDRGEYDQRMARTNLLFMLEQHLDDETDKFLESELFKRLHHALVEATAARWCREVAVVRALAGVGITDYKIDITRAELTVEM